MHAIPRMKVRKGANGANRKTHFSHASACFELIHGKLGDIIIAQCGKIVEAGVLDPPHADSLSILSEGSGGESVFVIDLQTTNSKV